MTVTDAAADYAMIALQGPEARGILDGLIEGEAPARMRAAETTRRGRRRRAGLRHRLHGRGRRRAAGPARPTPSAVWDALAGGGATPVGLGARDTLRLEVCFHLYGNDLSEDRNPIEAGLGWVCKLDTGFIGSDVLADVRADRDDRPVRLHRPGHPAPGQPGPHRATATGVVTSGTHVPCLEIGIGMAYVPRRRRPEPGTPIEVDVRGKRRPAEVRKRPLYEKES